RNGKPTEIELKLALPGPDVEEAVVAFLRENGYEAEKLDPVRNVDTYLDTFDWSLLKNKLALRHRAVNGEALYTVKSMGTAGEDGVAKRMEVEVKLDHPVEHPGSVCPKKIRRITDDLIFPRKLLQQIRVVTERRLYRLLSPERAEIELAFDGSSFRAFQKPGAARRMNELEAELIKGPAAALEKLSSLLGSKFAFSPSTGSKLEAAMARLRVSPPTKKAPPQFRVSIDDRVDLAVRKILGYQFLKFRENLPGVRRDIDTEFVHQARVATRRMRSALRLFEDAVPQAQGAYLQEEIRWLGGLFGTVRDLDVFTLNLTRFREMIRLFPMKKKADFETWIEKHRRAPLSALCEALDSSRCRTFERRFLQFLEKPLPRNPRPPMASKKLEEVGPALIVERFEAAVEQGKKVTAKPKLRQFHRLRIQMKKLRYACEFIGPAYGDRLNPFIQRMVEIQDCLGELQDTVFTRSFIDWVREDWRGKLVDFDLLFILGEIYQLQSEIERARKETFGKIWERFASEETRTLLREHLGVAQSPEPEEQKKT
ncbi:MAG TPA: CHAD domain-containing protein, partial [Thermodesulfobacteriota bacterium]|nr:CHAD domain-containing protein [Thermodesulfobacteriota bacterium]